MSDQIAVSKLDQGSHLPGDEDRDFKSFADEGYDPGEVVPGGYDPGKVVKGSLRDELIRVAVTLPKGSEDRLVLLELINGGDPGTRMVEARVAAAKEAKLREDIIRLAHRLPKGSDERKALLTTLKQAGCEKLPKALQQNCEDMKAGKKPGKGKSKSDDKDDKKDKKDDKKKDDGKMPTDVLEKFKSKKKTAAQTDVKSPEFQEWFEDWGDSFTSLADHSDGLINSAPGGHLRSPRQWEDRVRPNRKRNPIGWMKAILKHIESNLPYHKDFTRRHLPAIEKDLRLLQRTLQSKTAKTARLMKRQEKIAGDEAAQEEEAAQPGAVRKQDQPKTMKQRLNPTKLSPKKAALVRLAKTMEKGSAERKAILELAAGCEKLPNEKMQQLCEEKKEEGKKNDAKEKKEDKKAKVKTDDACMKKFQDKDGSFKGGKGAAFKNCVKGFEECATGVTDAAGLCATIGREHGKMASADAKTAARNAFKAARAQGETHEVALLAGKMAMRIRGE